MVVELGVSASLPLSHTHTRSYSTTGTCPSVIWSFLWPWACRTKVVSSASTAFYDRETSIQKMWRQDSCRHLTEWKVERKHVFKDADTYIPAELETKAQLRTMGLYSGWVIHLSPGNNSNDLFSVPVTFEVFSVFPCCAAVLRLHLHGWECYIWPNSTLSALL